MDWGVSMNFKIGDKVRILPSAKKIGVHSDELGKVGEVVSFETTTTTLRVKMDKPCTICNQTLRNIWYLKPYQIIPVVVVGQQLVFEFME